MAKITQTLQDVSLRAQTLVREEVELAKAEMTQKATSLARGTAVAVVAGVFAIFGLSLLLQGFAWLVWFGLFGQSDYFWGFFVVAAILFLVGALAGFIASRMLKAGSPPTPAMAIDQAKLIRETVSEPERAASLPTTTPETTR